MTQTVVINVAFGSQYCSILTSDFNVSKIVSTNSKIWNKWQSCLYYKN